MTQSIWNNLLQRVWNILAQLIVYFQCCMFNQITSSDSMEHTESVGSTARASHNMPPELIFHIIELAANMTAVPQPLDTHSAYPMVSAKPDFSSLNGLSGSCRTYHEAVQKAWYKTLYMRTAGDWEMVDQLGISVYVR